MANEPKCSLKSITSRITIESYAGLMQSLNLENSKIEKAEDKLTISDLVRQCLQDKFGGIELDEHWTSWVAEQKEYNLSRRLENRNKHRRHFGFISRIFRRK